MTRELRIAAASGAACADFGDFIREQFEVARPNAIAFALQFGFASRNWRATVPPNSLRRSAPQAGHVVAAIGRHFSRPGMGRKGLPTANQRPGGTIGGRSSPVSGAGIR